MKTKTHFIVLLTLALVAALGVPCQGETKDDIIAFYSRYRAVRSQAQMPYLRSPSAEPVITGEMRRFYPAGEVELLMFHAYEPKSFVVEDDFEFIALEEDGSQDGESASTASRDYFLITNETVIGEMGANGLRDKSAKVREVIWIRDDGGTLGIVGDPTLSSYFVRISDLRAAAGLYEETETRTGRNIRDFGSGV